MRESAGIHGCDHEIDDQRRAHPPQNRGRRWSYFQSQQHLKRYLETEVAAQ